MQRSTIDELTSDFLVHVVDDPDGSPVDKLIPGSEVASGENGYSESQIKEFARDALAAALTQGDNITITVDDGNDTITITGEAGGGGGEGYTESEIKEFARDAVGSALVPGTGIVITPADVADTITIAVGNLDATDVDFTPADGIAATDVAGAIAELAGDIGDVAGDLASHTHVVETTITKEVVFTFPEPADSDLSPEWRFKRAVTVTNVYATASGNPSGGAMRADVNKNGTTIFTTQDNRPNIADGTDSDMTATPDVTAYSAGDMLQVQIDTASGATGVVIVVEYTETFSA